MLNTEAPPVDSNEPEGEGVESTEPVKPDGGVEEEPPKEDNTNHGAAKSHADFADRSDMTFSSNDDIWMPAVGPASFTSNEKHEWRIGAGEL